MAVGRDQVAFLCAAHAHRRSSSIASARRERPPRLRHAARSACLLVMGVVGAALLAVPVVLTMQFLATSTRPSFGFGVAAMGSLPPESLATILFGNVFGSLRWTYDYWGPDWHSLDGRPGPTAPRTTSSPARSRRCFCSGTASPAAGCSRASSGSSSSSASSALFYALGRYTPVFAVVFDHFPGVDALSPPGGRHLPDQHRPRLRGRLPRAPLRSSEGSPRLARLRRPPVAALPALPGSSAWSLAAIASALGFALRAHHAARRAPRRGARPRPRGFAATQPGRQARGTTPRAAAPRLPRLIVALTGGELLWRNAASPLNAEPAERYAVFQQAAARAAAGPAGAQAGARRAQRPGRAPARRDPRPRRRLAERLDGARHRGHHRLQPAAPRRLRAARSVPARTPSTRTCASSRARSAATSAASPSLLGLEYLVLDRADRAAAAPLPAACRDAKLLYGSGTMWIYRLNARARRAPIWRRT